MPPPPPKDESFDVSRLYHDGPWYVVYGHGTESEDLADQIQLQCRAHGVDVIAAPIDEVSLPDLFDCFALIVVLPLSAGRLAPFTRLISMYRASRADGLWALRMGRRRWHQVRVIQVVGTSDIMSDASMREAMKAVDYQHPSGGHAVVDVFRPYSEELLPVPQRQEAPPPDDPGSGGDEATESVARHWRFLRECHVVDIAMVRRLRKCIEECVIHYNNPKYSANYRPLGSSVPFNRLQVILNPGIMDDNSILGSQKTWSENGAVVWRYVEKRMKIVCPTLERPAGSAGKKDATLFLYKLNQSLRIVDMYSIGDL